MILALLLSFAAPPLQPAFEKTPAAARAVIARYYRAIDARRYTVARRLWSDGGRASGKTLRAFAAGFTGTRHTRVALGAPTDADGAAGSLFVTVPVRIDAIRTDGTRQRFAGTYVLRQVNDVDDATLDQRRWHIASARLRLVRQASTTVPRRDVHAKTPALASAGRGQTWWARQGLNL